MTFDCKCTGSRGLINSKAYMPNVGAGGSASTENHLWYVYLSFKYSAA